MRLWPGTSGFSYKEWKGSFYPEDLPDSSMLSFYAERFGLRRGQFPQAEYHSDHALSLPFWSGMTVDAVDRVVDTIDRLLTGRA